MKTEARVSKLKTQAGMKLKWKLCFPNIWATFGKACILVYYLVALQYGYLIVEFKLSFFHNVIQNLKKWSWNCWKFQNFQECCP